MMLKNVYFECIYDLGNYAIRITVWVSRPLIFDCCFIMYYEPGYKAVENFQ